VRGDSGEEPRGSPGAATVNAVTLRGRVSRGAELRELPSGMQIATVRISVARSPSPMTKRSKQGSDWVDCVAWGAPQRRRVGTWRVGDLVEVEGALRRRVYRGGAGTAMPLEVEVLAGRMVRRGDRRPSGIPDPAGP
jgi:single-strand DNA-binding protein